MTTTLGSMHELLTAIAEPYQPWRERAACRGLGPEMFLPARGDSCAPAKAVCYRCEVRQDCLDYALAGGEKWGVWGGLSERQRRRLRRGLSVVEPEPVAVLTLTELRARRRRLAWWKSHGVSAGR